MMAKRAVIDIVNRKLYLCGPGDIKVELPPGSQTFQLEQSPSGHLLLPVSDFHTIKPPTDKLATQPPAATHTTTDASVASKDSTPYESPPSQ
eukprot:5835685-Lingulodinium_polyedra.AAC.1